MRNPRDPPDRKTLTMAPDIRKHGCRRGRIRLHLVLDLPRIRAFLVRGYLGRCELLLYGGLRHDVSDPSRSVGYLQQRWPVDG